MQIKKITKWQTSDGTEHSSKAMADQFILTTELVSILADQRPWARGDDLDPKHTAHDVLNTLSSYRTKVREWLDACDAMEKAALR